MGTKGGSDGRVLRGRRNREALVEALMSLLSEGDVKPTADTIAERAGTSRRSVFQHFSDVESIHEEVGIRFAASVAPLLVAVDPKLPVLLRTTAQVDLRRRLFEPMDPIARAARIYEPFSPQLRRNRQSMSAKMREQCRQTFAPELADLAPDEAARTLTALAGALSWSVWDHLTADLLVPEAGALAAMTHLVLGALGAAGTGPAVVTPARREGAPAAG